MFLAKFNSIIFIKTFLVTFFILTKNANGELFTSYHEMSSLVETQAKISEILKDYIHYQNDKISKALMYV
jgi:hypothetical protein